MKQSRHSNLESKVISFYKTVKLWMLALLLLAGLSSKSQTGGALNFTNGDYVDLGPSFNSLAFGTGAFTLETWFKSSMTDGTIMSKRSICNVSNFWNLRISSGKIRFEMMESSGVNSVDFSTPLTYNNNTWHHVAVTRSGTTVKIFMDGYVVATSTSAAITNLNNLSDPIKLGQSACSNFIGELDETRIWTEAQSVCEIYANKNYEFNSTLSSLKFNAHYNQGTAGGNNASVTSLTNSASNAIAGTLNTFSLSGSSSNWITSTCPAQGLSATAPSIQTTASCGNYVWEGITYPASGIYTRTLTSVVNGCDSLARLNLTVNSFPNPSIHINDSILCSGSNGSMVVTNSNAVSYCTPTTTNNSTNSDFISWFQFLGIDNTSSDGPGVYNNYSNFFGNLTAGANQTYLINYGGSQAQGSAIWIDYNQDGDFADAGEYVVSSPSNIIGPLGNFTVSSTAKNGLTRMRVACRRGATPAANQSCGGYDYGEFEDYNVIISGGQPNLNTYSWTPSTFLSSSSLVNPTFTNITSSTVYTVTLTDANGCSANATQSINVNPLPAAPLINSISNSICSGTTMNLTNSPNYCTPTVSGGNISAQHYIPSFSLGGSLIVNISGDGPGVYNYYQNVSANVSVGTLYSFVIGQGGSIATSKAIWIDLNQDGDFSDAGEFVVSAASSTNTLSSVLTIPSTAYNGFTRMRVAVSSASSITSGQSCSGFIFGEYEDYNLIISGGFNATTWAPSSPLNTSVGNPVQIINQTAITTYTVTITDANGCTRTDTQTISILTSPNVFITASADSVCSGNPVTLTATGATSYSWSNAVTNGLAFSPSATNTYTVTGTASNGCTKTATKLIKVNATPIAPNITGPNSVCPGDTVLLTTSNYCIPTTNPNVIFSSSYSISQFVFGSQIINNSFANVQINNTINLDSVYSNFTDQIAIAAAGNVYGMYISPEGSQPVYKLALIDYNQDGLFNLNSNEVVAVNQSPSNLALLANITIPASAKNGITRMRILTSSHNFGPDAACFIYDPTSLSNQAYGEYEDYSIYIYGGMPSNLTWSPASNLPINTGTGMQSVVHATTTYTLTVSDANGCSSSSTKTVTINSSPSVNINASSPGICIGSSVTLTASGASQYQWSNGVVNGAPFSPTTTTTYSVVGTSSAGCKDTAFIQIPVETTASIPNFTSAGACSGQQATIDLSSVYCTPTCTSNAVGYNYINSFSMNGNTLQNFSSEEPNNYTYFSNITANVIAGAVNIFTMNIVGPSSGYGAIWIDYNQDGDFADAGENVWSSSTFATTLSGSFTIPPNASNGITRMRIICTDSYPLNLGNEQCTVVGMGEYEDYNLNISGGQNTYVWSPSNLLTNTVGAKIKTVPLSTNTIFTVTATSAYGCTSTTTKNINLIAPIASVAVTSNSTLVCPGDSVQLIATATSSSPISVKDSLQTLLQALGSAEGSVFNIVATNTVTISSFKMHITMGNTASVWYKAGGYGNANVVNNSGWTQLGTFVPIIPAGLNALTTIPLTDSITIPAGQTYGFAVVCNGTALFSAGTSAGAVYTSNADIAITQGHAGNLFNFTFSPTIWNGEVVYRKQSPVSSYTWSSAANFNNPSIANPKAVVNAATNYQVTVTDANGCTISSSVSVDVKSAPSVTAITSNNTICIGNSTVISATGADSYTWQPGNIFGTFINVNPVVSTTYTVTGTGANGCKNSATKTITVNSAPMSPTLTTSTNTLCDSGNVSLTATTSTDYCLPIVYYSGSSGYYISNVNFNSGAINNTTGEEAGEYSYYSSMNANVIAGNSYGLNITTALSNSLFKGVFIDYNQDGDFTDSGEFVWSSTASIGSSSGTIVIPLTASNGITRMRVICRASTIINASMSCYNNDIGEYEDYNLTISGGVAPAITYTYAWSPATFLNTTNTQSVTATNVNTTTTYTVVASNSYGCTKSANTTITVNPCNLTLNLKLFLQGYYSGANSMTHTLMNQGVGTNSSNVDSIEVTLRNSVYPYSMVATNKTILTTNGTATINFASNVPLGNYYIVVKHRNIIETWSSNPISISLNTNYDFTTDSNKAFGNNMVEVEPGVWAFYSGDINQDENVDLIDATQLETDINNFQFGYLATDINGDGNVDLLDTPITETNITEFVFSSHP